VEEFGMMTLGWDETPEGAHNTFTWFGVNETKEDDWEDFWSSWPVVEIPPETVLYTGQKHLSGTAIAEEEDEDLPLLVMVEGQHWIVDGHHRLARSRRQGQPQEVRLADYEEAVKGGWFDQLLESIAENEEEGEGQPDTPLVSVDPT